MKPKTLIGVMASILTLGILFGVSFYQKVLIDNSILVYVPSLFQMVVFDKHDVLRKLQYLHDWRVVLDGGDVLVVHRLQRHRQNPDHDSRRERDGHHRLSMRTRRNRDNGTFGPGLRHQFQSALRVCLHHVRNIRDISWLQFYTQRQRRQYDP